MSPERTLHAIGNAHIDPVWLWRWPEGLETIRATFRSALDRLAEYPDFVFTCSSSAFYELLEQVEPDMLAEIRARVQEGRWELVGGWWVEPDVNIPSGESLLRQGLYGQRYLEDAFGRRARVGYNPDTFGHPWTLPQILRELGLDAYVFMRPGPHEKSLPGPVFLWRGPDGTEVITLRIARSYATWGKDVADHVRACAYAAPDYLRDYAVFYGVGNHGGGPTKENIECLLSLPEVDRYAVRLSSLGAVFDGIREQMSAGATVPVVSDELQHHARGCYTAHQRIKRGNRRVEHLLMAAERATAMAWEEAKFEYPHEELTSAWKALLFTQFHDILAGTSIAEAYEDARDAHGYAAQIASRTIHTALQRVARQADTRGEGEALVLFNTLPWPVRVPVEIERGGATLADEAGHRLPAQRIQPSSTAGQRRSCFVADLPAMGFRIFRELGDEAEQPAAPAVTVRESMLTNRWLEVRVDPRTGMVASLFDHRCQTNLLRPDGMMLRVFRDESDTWSHDVTAFREEVGRFEAVGEAVVEDDGPVRVCLRSRLAWQQSEVVHRVRVYADLDRVEGELKIMWREHHAMLKLCIPTVFKEAVVACEVPYGVMERPQDGEEHPLQQWCDVSASADARDGTASTYGLSVLNDGVYGYDACDGELRLSLLRGPVYAHHDPAVLDPTKNYVYMDQGEHTFRYALVPHLGDWRDADIPRQAVEFNCPPVWVHEYAHSGRLSSGWSFLSVEPRNVVVLVCKRAEDGDGIVVRAVETSGRTTQARFHLASAGIAWEAQLGPWEIASFRVQARHEPAVTRVNALEDTVLATPS